MLDLEEWGWKDQPDTPEQFEAMMISLDAYLARKRVQPHQRPIAAKSLVCRLVGTVFALGAAAVDPTADRASEWLKRMYGKRLNPPFRSRSFVVDIRGTLWRVRIGVVYGHVVLFPDRNIANERSILHGIDDLTQDFANTLTVDQIHEIGTFVELAQPAFDALGGFGKHRFFDIAWLDYEHSVNALMSGIDWGKAWWETAQTAEKVMKGMLDTVSAGDYPRGPAGHDIVGIGKKVDTLFKVELPRFLLEAIHCETAVRYGDREATREETLRAHYALLKLLPLLFEAFYRLNAPASATP